MKNFVVPAILVVSVVMIGATVSSNDPWPQWGHDARHSGFSPVAGQAPTVMLADIVYDPFVPQAQAESGGDLLAHYQAPLVSGNSVYMEFKTGSYTSCPTPGSWQNGDICGPNAWNSMTWNERRLDWHNGQLETVWTFESDWKPEWNGTFGLAGWEPVFHPVLSHGFLYVPGFGGALWKVNIQTGAAVAWITPFGTTHVQDTFVSSPLTADAQGNIYYNVLKLQDPHLSNPWFASDIKGAWLVKVAPDGGFTMATYKSLVPGAPAADDFNCPGTFFDLTTLPWPPSPSAVAPGFVCGSQRPGVNIAPAVAPDGTIYTISRGHFNSMVAYLVAVNPDLTPKWQASLQNRLTDGCGFLVPIAPPDNPNQPNSCRVGSNLGVDPTTNAPGSGSIIDQASSTPTVLPDGSILVGVTTNYGFARGELFKFSRHGEFLGNYNFGWDSTAAVRAHDGTYSIVLKDNHYGGIGNYCFDPTSPICAPRPNGPYFITQLNANLVPEWQFRDTTTESCQRNPDGSVTCIPNTHPNGFEWCINAPAFDVNGNVYVNSEDGNMYVIDPHGNLVGNIFTNLAIGAAYTPLSLGPDGKIYTQNDGQLFVVGDGSN